VYVFRRHQDAKSQELLGHEDVETTMDRHARASTGSRCSPQPTRPDLRVWFCAICVYGIDISNKRENLMRTFLRNIELVDNRLGQRRSGIDCAGAI
jgi:hypothetical protein